MTQLSIDVRVLAARTLCLLCPGIAAVLPAQSLPWLRALPATSPTPRAQAAAASDAARAQVVLFGGDAGAVSDDTWSWNGHDWLPAVVAVHPSARRGHAMAYDATRQRVVLFGGFDANQVPLGDTWEWDGATWTQRTPTVAPSARGSHAMAWDPTSQSVLLFGGGPSAAFALGDTWQWNGTAWTQVPPVTGPVARQGHALATDPVRQRVVLFGGTGPVTSALADTWEWNGAAWLPALSVVGGPIPTPRSGHQLAFDVAAGGIVLFGGSGPQPLADAWRFDGTLWTQLTPSGPQPGARSGHVLAADPARRGLLLFGGAADFRFADSWSTTGDDALVYGRGCGTPPLRFVPDAAAPPVLGQVAAAAILDAPTTAAAVSAGFDNQFFGPFPLPLPLTGIGMPGCDLLQTAEFFGLAASPTGPNALSFQLAVPNLATLLGLHFYLQAYAFAPGQNPAQAVISNGIDWTIGDGSNEQVVVEDFDGANQLDADASAGTWAAGLATFAAIGGDGRHGAFDLANAIDDGIVDGLHQYALDTDNTVIPASHTLTGSALVVTDGRFSFTEMVVPSGVRLTFRGSVPPVVTVAGRLEILGVVDVAGRSTAAPSPGAVFGQPGGAGGVFGGSGGKGGDRGNGLVAQAANSGQDGADARLLAAHAYASTAVGSGGRGSSQFPLDGLSSSLIYPNPLPSLAYTPSAAAGGGGGGNWQMGGTGLVLSNNHFDPVLLVPPRLDAMGPPAPGGSAVQRLPFPVVPGLAQSSTHFLIGGAGGGGAGSHACLALHLVRTWCVGGGGGGGGGAIALRAGNLLRVGAAASVRANGGSTFDSAGLATSSQPAPGGGGAGGSIVLQSGSQVDIAGTVDVRGGEGGLFQRFANGSPAFVPNSASVQIAGGGGGAGFVRLELPGAPTVALLPGMLPAPVADNVAPLQEQDALVSARSRWYVTGAFGATFRRYEIRALVDGLPILFSDDPAVSPEVATVGAPLRVRFQAANVDPVTGAVLSTGPWRTAVANGPGTVGIATDGGNAFRFQLVFDRAIVTSLAVDRVVVVHQ